MNFDLLQKAIDIKKAKDDATTIAEHSDIILRYKKTGYLDRDDAVRKYTEFNDNHREYCVAITAVANRNGTLVHIDDKDIPDGVIIDNLNQQLLYLTGKNLLEELNHAQPTT